MRLVLTRPQDDSERSAAALRARGHEVLIAPLMRIEMITADLRPPWGAVIVTSANAAAAVATHPARDALIKLPVYAVGKRSADAARSAGFSNVASAGGDLRDLVRIISERGPDNQAPLLYLAGEDRAGDLIGDLAVHGIAAELAVVYRAVTAPFPPELIAALKAKTVDGVLHFFQAQRRQLSRRRQKSRDCHAGPRCAAFLPVGADRRAAGRSWRGQCHRR